MKTVEIYCPIASKDAIVDFMLDQGENKFYFFPCSQYGTGTLLSSAEEQVSARSQFGMFRLAVEDERVDRLSDGLKAHIKDKSIKIHVYNVEER